MRLCRAAKQGVDGRPRPVHARAAREHHVASADQKMMVGRRDVNISGTDEFALSGVTRRQARAVAQQIGELAGVGANVEHGKDCCGNCGWQMGKELLHRLDASVGGADNHDCEIAGLDLLVHEPLTRGAMVCSERRPLRTALQRRTGMVPFPRYSHCYLLFSVTMSRGSDRRLQRIEFHYAWRASTAGWWPCCRKPINITAMRANASAWRNRRKRRSIATSSLILPASGWTRR